MSSKNVLQKIKNKLDLPDLLEQLGKQLSFSQLNTFLLELFKIRSTNVTPAGLLRQFQENRFVLPGDIDVITFKETELSWLKKSMKSGFQPVQLSPLAPFASSSAIATIDQNNVVSALRGTEVVSDATNVLALKIAEDFKKKATPSGSVKYSTTHRHVRAQYFDNPDFTAHFGIFCLATGGYDSGNYSFELKHLNDHMTLIGSLLREKFDDENMIMRFYLKKNSGEFAGRLKGYKNGIWHHYNTEFADDPENEYYQLIQFKFFLKRGNTEIDIADGGFVDWTQKILSNNKHRLMISGIGLELFLKLDP